MNEMTLEDLKRLKKYAGYTNAMIAEKSGVPLSTVQKVFSGNTESPRYGTLKALYHAFSDGQAANDPDIDSSMVGEENRYYAPGSTRSYNNTVYYLKEVPEAYLRGMIRYTYYDDPGNKYPIGTLWLACALDGEYSEFKYKVCLTPELTTQLLSMGEYVEVLEPKELKDTMKERLKKALKTYKD